jgi:hypothetical protein
MKMIAGTAWRTWRRSFELRCSLSTTSVCPAEPDAKREVR